MKLTKIKIKIKLKNSLRRSELHFGESGHTVGVIKVGQRERKTKRIKKIQEYLESLSR